MINRDHKSWGKWKIGVIENIFMGKDNIIRSIRTCTGKSIIESSAAGSNGGIL